VSTASTTSRATTVSTGVRVASLVTMIAGLVLAVAGVVTWFTVQSSLADEKITVSSDSPRFAGDKVDGPLAAYQEANMIKKHYLESTAGKTYAQLDREDPLRQTAMTASFLRASLFTSVVAFGVAAMAFGLGIVLMLVGWALPMAGRRSTAADAG